MEHPKVNKLMEEIREGVVAEDAPNDFTDSQHQLSNMGDCLLNYVGAMNTFHKIDAATSITLQMHNDFQEASV